MSSHTHDPIYNQDDMDVVLEALSKAKREAELSHQLLWAVVQAAGGHVKVHYSLWSGEPERDLIMWDDPATLEMNIKVREKREVQDV